MTQWQEDLPPLVREKLARIGDATPEEKARMKDLAELDSVLAGFFAGTLDAEGLYHRLKDYERQGKHFLLEEARSKLQGSFREKESRLKFEDAGEGQLSVTLLEEEETGEAAPLEGAATVLELTDDDIDQAVRKHRVLVVDCWAPWCAPCRMIAPIIQELAREYRGRVAFGKLNVDQNPASTAKYGIMSIPALLVFKDWQLVDQLVGAMPKAALEQRLAPYL